MMYDRDLNSDFTFSERYAGWKELQQYFQHIGRSLGRRAVPASRHHLGADL